MLMMYANSHEHLEAVCHAIADQLKDLARKRAAGEITEAAFINMVLKVEAEEVASKGMTLTASHTADDWTVFKIKINGTSETCAAFEFLPETGQFRRLNEREA
jgi:hypothetical protein